LGFFGYKNSSKILKMTEKYNGESIKVLEGLNLLYEIGEKNG
jgi:hypothetical protein